MIRHLTRRGFLASATAAVGIPIAADVPLGKLHVTKFVVYKATVRWRDLLFLEVHTDGGLVGYGEGSLYTRVPMVEEGLRWLEPHMAGLDPSGVPDHWDRLYYRLTRWRSGPVIVTALSALDIALWDLEAKRLGVPLWRLLGASPQNKIRPYFTHWDRTFESTNPAAFGPAAKEARADGWTAVKFDAATNEPTESKRIAGTVQRLEAIRSAVGDDLDIALEMGESMTPREAIRFAEAMKPYHPLFLEEITLRDNPEAMAQVAAKSPVPLATGEGLNSRYEFLRLLQSKGAAILQPDVLHCGGITELRRIADLALPFEAELAPHQCYGPIAHAASANAVMGCRSLLLHEWEAQDDALFREVTEGTYPVQKDGTITLSDRPGLGIAMNFAEFAKRFPFQPGARSMPVRMKGPS
jgi:galactonate dehydratase